MSRPLAHYLAEFGRPPQREALVENSLDAACQDQPDEPVVEDTAALLQTARDEGIAEGYAAARSEYEAQIEQDRLAFEDRLAAERDQWSRQESEKLSDDIKTLLAEIESTIAGSVARILTPFVVESLRQRMIDLLAETVGVLLGGKEHSIIQISGPEDLLAMLRDRLMAFSGAIDFAPDESIDVRIVADQTMIESRLEAWLERIRSLPE